MTILRFNPALANWQRKVSSRPLGVPSGPPVLSDYFYDLFTGTHGSNVNGRTPTLSPNSNTWTTRFGVALINSNRLEISFASNASGILTYNTGSADETITAKVTIPTTGGNSRQIALVGRYSNNSNFWMLYCDFGNSLLKLIVNNAGSWSVPANPEASTPFVFVGGTEHILELSMSGQSIQGRIDGANPVSTTSSTHLTNTNHGVRAANGLGGESVFFDDFVIEPAVLANATATVSNTSYRTSNSRVSLTIVDNNLRTGFAGATTQKNTALSNLAGKFHNINFFLESFGNGSTLSTWDGVGTDVGDMPQPSLNNLKAHMTQIVNDLDPDTLGIFVHRIPWQFTGSTNSSGVTTPSTSADYNEEGRRLLTDRSDQYVEWVARCFHDLFEDYPILFAAYLGSEGKGFQVSVPVVVNGNTIRPTYSNSWEWDDYAGTAGRADMGNFHYFKLFRQGVLLGATRAGKAHSSIHLVSPYPVIAHRGVRTSGSSIVSNSINDANGSPVDYSDVNGDNNSTFGGYGWINRGAAVLTAEHVRFISEGSYHNQTETWDFGSDFGTFNTDNNLLSPMPTDHNLAYNRVKLHNRFYRKLFDKYSVGNPDIRYPEYYAKAQAMATIDNLTALGSLTQDQVRQRYQGTVRGAFLIAAYEDGIAYPDMWSPFGRGDQTTDSGSPADSRQWYGGIVKRTVTNDDNHPGSPVTGGGAEQEAMVLIESLKTYFPPGTPLHAITFSESGWMGLASNTKALIMNLEGEDRTLAVDGLAVQTFTPYQIRVLDH